MKKAYILTSGEESKQQNHIEEKYAHENVKLHERYILRDYLRTYYAERQNVYHNNIAWIEANAIIEKSQNKKHILLIGVGFGRELDLLLKSCDAKITILDVNSNFLKTIAEVYNPNRIDTLKIDLNKVPKIPIESDSFDLVISLNTLEYVISDENTRLTLLEIHRVLIPGGVFFTRFLNGSSIQGRIINKLMLRRPPKHSKYTAKKYEFFMNCVADLFEIQDCKLSDYFVNFGPLRYLYNNHTGFTVFIVGRIISQVIGRKQAPVSYFTFTKK